MHIQPPHLLVCARLSARPWPAAVRAVPARAQPVMVEGQAFDRRDHAGRQRTAAQRHRRARSGLVQGLCGGLYLRTPSRSAAQVLAQAGPKRLQMRMLQDVPAAEFVKAFRKGVERNTAAAELPQLAERMASFEALVAALGKVRKGDLVDLDLEPGRGTAVQREWHTPGRGHCRRRLLRRPASQLRGRQPVRQQAQGGPAGRRGVKTPGP